MAIREKYIVTLLSSIVRILLMLLLIIPYGILGVIVGITLARFFTFFLSLFLVKKL